MSAGDGRRSGRRGSMRSQGRVAVREARAAGGAGAGRRLAAGWPRRGSAGPWRGRPAARWRASDAQGRKVARRDDLQQRSRARARGARRGAAGRGVRARVPRRAGADRAAVAAGRLRREVAGAAARAGLRIRPPLAREDPREVHRAGGRLDPGGWQAHRGAAARHDRRAGVRGGRRGAVRGAGPHRPAGAAGQPAGAAHPGLAARRRAGAARPRWRLPT